MQKKLQLKSQKRSGVSIEVSPKSQSRTSTGCTDSKLGELMRQFFMSLVSLLGWHTGHNKYQDHCNL